jgi:hypothetical protein
MLSFLTICYRCLFSSFDLHFCMQACHAIGNLAANDENGVRLVSAGACELMVSALKWHGESSAEVALNVRY